MTSKNFKDLKRLVITIDPKLVSGKTMDQASQLAEMGFWIDHKEWAETIYKKGGTTILDYLRPIRGENGLVQEELNTLQVCERFFLEKIAVLEYDLSQEICLVCHEHCAPKCFFTCEHLVCKPCFDEISKCPMCQSEEADKVRPSKKQNDLESAERFLVEVQTKKTLLKNPLNRPWWRSVHDMKQKESELAIQHKELVSELENVRKRLRMLE
jgi:hypothetical protein